MGTILRRDLIESNPEEFARVNSDKDSNGCWIWKHCKLKKKSKGKQEITYGVMGYKGNNREKVIRIVKPGPEELHVLHSCNNKSCVNPSHLRRGTHAENMRDKCVNGDCIHCKDQTKPGKITWSVSVCKKYQCCLCCWHTSDTVPKKKKLTLEQYLEMRREANDRRRDRKRSKDKSA